MPGPLIPYIEAPEIPLGFLEHVPLLGQYIDPASPPSIKPFGTLVAIGVYVGAMVATSRSRERGIHQKHYSDFIFWVVAIGFVLSHMIDAIFYHPDTVAEDPLYLLRVWDGLSSYGGLIGATIGAFLWKMSRKQKILEMCDVTVSAFPIAWVFGRAGCASVHDHPGALSNAWFAVKFPAHQLADGYAGRYDLGLIEMVLTIPLAIACTVLWRRQPRRPAGFFIGLTLTCYAPVRFILDFLRVDPDEKIFRGATDIRYLGLTFAQWVCIGALALGIFFLRRTWSAEYKMTAPAEPAVDDEDDEDDEEDELDDEERAEKEERRRRAQRRKARREKRKSKRRQDEPAADADGDGDGDAKRGDGGDDADADPDDADGDDAVAADDRASDAGEAPKKAAKKTAKKKRRKRKRRA